MPCDGLDEGLTQRDAIERLDPLRLHECRPWTMPRAIGGVSTRCDAGGHDVYRLAQTAEAIDQRRDLHHVANKQTVAFHAEAEIKPDGVEGNSTLRGHFSIEHGGNCLGIV